MNLDDYLRAKGISSTKFAAMVGVSIHAVPKWRQKTRMPRPKWKVKIERVTHGQVKVSDWYTRFRNQ